ncbi:hypothetical protein SAMN06295974_3809 [Plantibacter flavus]|uniref:Uncharacterized protein n=1 Tax=Plantibacter flavus TaxID=150123 RepID=A0A3N2BLX8_9MICO|nr:hypothetical protein [Plantibacter flavus]ROR76044.1 hypothetical protein EDD42_3997 [Plantibacter flavus]SMG49027.1 hypothetical protein SAMN06295974_3809 [Plantibacter flavus]
MKISTTFYNDEGELMAPRELDVKLSSVTPGGFPSLEEGFYHRFKFEGRTEAELETKSRRFFAEMNDVSGYLSLVIRPYSVEMGNYVRHGIDVIYVVESAKQAEQAAAQASARRATQAHLAPSTVVAASRTR